MFLLIIFFLQTELSNKEEPALEVSAPDKLEPIFERVKANRFDLEAWETLLRCISSSSSDHLDDLTKEIIGYSLEKLPPIVNLEFSSLFVHAPILNEIFSKPSLWLELIQLVKSQQGGPSLAAVFKNVLCKVRSLELCKKYLSYVKTVRNVSPREQQQKIDSVMTEAYELVLERIGHEIDSGSLWSEYVSYLRSHKVS